MTVSPQPPDGGLLGVDVSHYQSEIDWPAVAAAGVRFAYVKATEGATFLDPRFLDNVAKARDAGITVGAYHFFRFTSSQPIPQASWFWENIEKAGLTGRDSLPPAGDLEWADHKEIDAKERAQRAFKFMNNLESLAKRVPVLYLGPSFWKYELKETSTLDRWPLWQAKPGASQPSANLSRACCLTSPKKLA